jgi:MFS transporter, ACS family, glucarate transporter
MARAFSRWFPARERGRANGVLFLGSRVGGMLSAPVALLLIRGWGWRASFVAIGSLGLVWAVWWHRWFRDRPSEHPDVDEHELAWIEQDGRAGEAGPAGHGHRVPWRAMARSRNVYAIGVMYFTYGYGLYFYFTWLPTYLIRVLGFSLLRGGLFAALPFLLAGIADVAGGWLTDRLSGSRGLWMGRCVLGSASFLGSAVLLFASTLPQPASAGAILLAFALASADLALSACWAVPLDIAPDHAGVVSGCMNTFGNLGGLAGPLVVGLAVERWHSWAIPLHIAAAVYVAGALAWLAIDPTRRIATDGIL